MTSNFPNSNALEDLRFISTGCKRLDQSIGQYGKGFEYRKNRPISILIKGKPGVGKSTLSAQIADTYISDFGESDEPAICVYFSLDEDPNSVEARIKLLFGPELPYRIETIENIKESIGIEKLSDIDQMDQSQIAEVNQEIQQIGIVIGSLEFPMDHVLSSESKTSYQSFVDKVELISRWLEFFAKSPKAANLVIIDSLNALRGDIPSRTLLSMFLSLVKLEGYNSIFVLEDDRDSQVEEFLVDVVMELGFSEGDPIPRFLKVCKARDHDIIPVENDMIIDQNGIRVYPDVESLLKPPHFALIPEALDADGMPNCFFDISGLDRELHPPLVGGRAERGIKRGSTTLLMGQEGTGKAYLSLNFLKAGFYMGEQVLYISLGTARSSVLDIAKSVYGLDPAIRYKKLPERVMPPTEFIDRVYQAVFVEEENTYAGVPKGRISRVAIDDLGILSLSYTREELIRVIRTLVGVFKKANITAIITYSTSDILDRSDFDMVVDNVITTSYIGQGRHPSICVRRFGGAMVQSKLQELRYDPDNKEFLVYPGVFEGLIELPDGKVSPGKLKIYYYAGETSALGDLANELSASIGDTFLGAEDEKPIFDRFGQPSMGRTGRAFSRKALLKGLLSHPSFSGTTDTRIVMFDEPWAPALREKLMEIREIDESYARLFEKGDKQVFLGSQYPILPPVTYGDGVDGIFGVPFYANFSHLCYRRDLIKHYYAGSQIIKDHFSANGEIKGEQALTWDAISRICGHVVELEKSSQKSISKKPEDLLEFYFGLDEASLASFFLELVWPIIFQKPDAYDLQIKNLPNLAPDMVRWLKIVQDWWNKLSGMDTIEDGDLISGKSDFVFGRLWYACSAPIEHERSIELGYCRIPSLRDHQADTCISGNWYFGILKGSANPHRALKIIRQMTNKSTNNDIFHTKAALPTHRFYWDKELGTEFIPEKIIELFKDAKSRCQIVNFHRIPSVLESGFTKLLAAQPSAVKAILEVMQSEIDNLTRD
ncbi:ATPase domain-containing protein [Candidatus Poribacteria bacterium]